MWQKQAFQILSLLYSASLLLVLFLGYNYVQYKSHQVQAAKDRVMQETLVAVQQIDEELSQLSSIAHTLADEIGSGKLPRSQIRGRLEETMDRTPHLFGIGVAYIPYVNDPQTRRHSPYYINRPGTLQIEEQDQLQLFIVPCSYSDPTTQYKISKCVVFVEYSLKKINALMTTLDFGNTGYGFILSKQGVFIAHPIEEYVKSRKTIFNIAEIHNDNALKRLGERAINSESGVMEYIDEVTGQSSWIFYQPIPTTGWVMGAIVRKNEFLGKTIEVLRHKQIWISIWLIIFLGFFSALLFRAYQGDNLWQVVFSTSMLLLVGIGFIWYLAQTAPYSERAENAIIVDKAGLNKFLSSNIKPRFLSKESPISVPTGVLIESVEFSGENNVILSGHIWQKYDDDVHNGVSRGFILPDAQSINITEVDRHKENQREVIRWYFEGTVRQQFDYSKYPLDRREINLLIYHKDVDRNVILTPDLDAYQWINPIARPGVKYDLVLPGWNMKSSFFNYRTQTSDTHFEINHEVGERHFPNFYFTVFIQRDFLNPFIESMLPLIVVGGMLFAILLLLGKVKTFANMVAPLAALFIGVVLAHIGLRKGITASEILYVEYFYIVMYIAILAVVVSYFLFYIKSNLFFIRYRDGLLVAKLLFWPLILGSMLGITVWIFYDV